MAIIDLYDKYIFKKLKAPTSITYPIPVAVPLTNPPMTDTDTIKKIAVDHYSNAPLLQSTYLGSSDQPLVVIKPNDPSSLYSNKLNYTLTRAGATANWLISPEGLRFSLYQAIGQTFNPTLETKIWKPNSVLSNLIPLTGYHERRHMTLSNLFGLPGLSLIIGSSPETYTEAVFGSDKKSRVLYQSPAISFIDGKEYVGIDYANIGRDIMSLAKTWTMLNPNRYSYPIGADGGGLPNSNINAPYDELNVNLGLASQAWRYTKATGFNPVLDAQITMNQQFSGTSFLQKLLKSIPFANIIMNIFGYGILGASAPKIKIYNSYNPTFPYSKKKGKQIRVVNNNGELLDTYDLLLDNKTPLEQLLYAVESLTGFGVEKAQTGITFADGFEIEKKSQVGFYIEDSRVIYNPQDNTPTLNQYLQSYGDLSQKRTKDKEGTLNIKSTPSVDDKKPYSKYMQEDIGVRVIYRPDGRGFAWSGAKRSTDRQGDALNLLPLGEDSEGKLYQDLIPFKFYHVNERKWVVFRAALDGITDNVTPEWNTKRYIGRADEVYIYRGATRNINFNFTVMIYSPKELKPVYEKINYLMGMCWPTYRKLSTYGNYMEAPFVRLTIGDLFTDVYGVLDGGITITFDDEMTWEIRDEQPDSDSGEKIKIAKVPRLMNITVSSFTPFSLDNKPISANSSFYSAINKWKRETV